MYPCEPPNVNSAVSKSLFGFTRFAHRTDIDHFEMVGSKLETNV